MKAETIMNAIGGLEDEFIDKFSDERPAVQAVEKERNIKMKRTKSIIAAAVACLLLIAAVFGTFELIKQSKRGNNEVSLLPEGFAFLAETSVPEGAILPPKPQGKYSALYERPYSVAENYAQHEIAAIVTVGSWLYEDDSATYYEAKVERVYKGALPETVTLAMVGNSQSVEERFVLLSAGEKLLIFTQKWGMPGHEDKNEYEIGPISTLFVALGESGSIWLADIAGYIGMETEKDKACASIKNAAGSASEAVRKYLSNFDPAFESMSIPFICSLEDAVGVFTD